jgi:transcriptional regulator with XRE-family HTH domain
MLFRGMIRENVVEVANNRIDIPRRIVFLRTKEGMTQDQLAKKIGTTASAVCSWEKGRVSPSGDMIRRICAATGVTIDTFVTAKSNVELI